MKKIIFLLFILIPIISASPEITFQHEDIQAGETVLATIATSGEFSEQIESSNIEFYEGRKKISMESDIAFYEGIYYLYAYTTRQGNFTLKIPDILYMEDDILKAKTIEKIFTVSDNLIITNETTNETTTEILSIRPGFIFTTQVPKLKLINQGESSMNVSYSENETQLSPSSSEEIEVTPEEVFSYFNFSTYKDFSIPIIYLAKNSSFVAPTVKYDLRSNTKTLISELLVDIESEEIVELFNFGDDNITNISAYTQSNFTTIQDIQSMAPRQTQNITLTFLPESPGHFQDTLNISYTQNGSQELLSIYLSLFVLPQGSDPVDFEVLEKSCEDLSGLVCQLNQSCEGTSKFAKNSQLCCLGACKDPDPVIDDPGDYGWVMGIIIMVVLGGVIYYFYKKQKNVASVKPEDKLKEDTKKFEKKFETKPQRVVGGLSKN